jgi:phosphate transport system protein
MGHLRQTFEQQLNVLEQKVVRLGVVVEEMLQGAMKSLIEQDVDLARRITRKDDEADLLDFEIEQFCIHLLASQQPLSKDLRTITAIIKIIADLERVGDYSVDIAKTGERMAGHPYFTPLVRIPKMGERVAQLIHETLRAFVDRDLNLARQCIDKDDEIDNLHDELFVELLQIMQDRPETVPQAARFLLISRYLERIADHCTNISERLFYIETGRLVELKIKEEDKIA